MMIDDVVVVVDVVDVVDVDVVDDDDDNDDDDVFDGVMMGCDIFYSMSLNQLNSLCLLVASFLSCTGLGSHPSNFSRHVSSFLLDEVPDMWDSES